MIHGPGNKGNLNLLYAFVKKGLPWPLGAYDALRSFASIDNVVYIVRQLIENPVVPGIYNIADDTPLSSGELIRLMGEHAGKRTRIWKVPPAILRVAARAGDLLRLPLNSERLKKLTEPYVVSNRKIKTALNIEKLPTGTVPGIRKTLQSL